MRCRHPQCLPVLWCRQATRTCRRCLPGHVRPSPVARQPHWVGERCGRGGARCTARETDWGRIVALYDALVELTESPIVELNRIAPLGDDEGERELLRGRPRVLREEPVS